MAYADAVVSGGVDAACETSSCVRTSKPFPRKLAVVVALGFGLFYGVSTSSYLSAFASIDESFLFVPDIFFNVVVAISVVIAAGTIIVLTLRGSLRAFSLPYWTPLIMLIIINVAVLFDIFAALPWGLSLLIPGIVYGISSVIIRLVWFELFAVQKPSAMMYQMALGFAIGAVLSIMLQSVSAFTQSLVCSVLLVVVGLCIHYARRRVAEISDGGSLLDTVQDRAIAAGTAGTVRPAFLDRCKSAFLSIGDALIAFWVLEAVVGLLNSFMQAAQISFAGSGSVTLLARICSLAIFSLFAFTVCRFPKISTFSRVVMPMLAALLVFLPFLSEGYSLFFNIMLLGSYYFIAMLITYLAVEAAYAYRVSVYILMGVAMMGTRLCLAVALIVGHTMGSWRTSVFGDGEDTLYFLMVIVVVIYALSMATVLLSRGVRRRNEDKRWFGSRMTEPIQHVEAVVSAAEHAEEEPRQELDHALDNRCHVVAAEYGLTERETEIVALLARGRTKAYIAKTLFVTENTVRSHVRNLYIKLDVHTRQELIDLIEGSECP